MSHLELGAGYTETKEFIDMLDRRVEKGKSTTDENRECGYNLKE